MLPLVKGKMESFVILFCIRGSGKYKSVFFESQSLSESSSSYDTFCTTGEPQCRPLVSGSEDCWVSGILFKAQKKGVFEDKCSATRQGTGIHSCAIRQPCTMKTHSFLPQNSAFLLSHPTCFFFLQSVVRISVSGLSGFGFRVWSVVSMEVSGKGWPLWHRVPASMLLPLQWKQQCCRFIKGTDSKGSNQQWLWSPLQRIVPLRSWWWEVSV